MIPRKLVIATRASSLAVKQSEYVRERLLNIYPDLIINILTVVTKGDRILDRALSKVGGKGLFVKEIELAIRSGQADFAVHSMKDIPAETDDDLDVCSILERENPSDVFVSNNFKSIEDLNHNCIIGTSSLRREAQIKSFSSNLVVQSLRGNINTRLDKLDAGHYDAIILAAAGLKRLNLDSRIRQYIDYDIVLPAVAQGALGLQIMKHRDDLRILLSHLSCRNTTICVSAERAVLRILGGSCQIPIASNAKIVADKIFLRSLVSSVDGKHIVRAEGSACLSEAISLGENLAEQLLLKGADKILSSFVK
ncbi:hydroxymethylbilane synthase hemC [Candidatus Kinetoplastibacterium desouzaii TCC079E]|uniref:Porphobilinogen deaminase n=1 Tax=Candidatus Kinetoplastidibacterium desouzai TCC079E TaxID=1208919 RepID=M1LRK6_9PROT|nr:hydroxymethylbilane synthase [Candidatus Kinetoplastibacterium desouzaii]AGF46766.1 hydroxymethylbilane synthase hemC [Candidatus Kinetoplastibacterium desouzaii TCC079E]